MSVLEKNTGFQMVLTIFKSINSEEVPGECFPNVYPSAQYLAHFKFVPTILVFAQRHFF